ncbi:kinase [Weissella confusa]|nr:kinase [Weissella confusa]
MVRFFCTYWRYNAVKPCKGGMSMSFDIVLIRGNSASGKSTVAKALQLVLPNTMLISQDEIRRNMLRESDRDGSDTMRVIELLVAAAKEMNRLVILDGIFRQDTYGDWLVQLFETYSGTAWYLNTSLATTKVRHAGRAQSKDFGDEHLEAWYRPHDTIDALNEYLVPETWTQDDTVKSILRTLSDK